MVGFEKYGYGWKGSKTAQKIIKNNLLGLRMVTQEAEPGHLCWVPGQPRFHPKKQTNKNNNNNKA